MYWQPISSVLLKICKSAQSGTDKWVSLKKDHAQAAMYCLFQLLIFNYHNLPPELECEHCTVVKMLKEWWWQDSDSDFISLCVCLIRMRWRRTTRRGRWRRRSREPSWRRRKPSARSRSASRRRSSWLTWTKVQHFPACHLRDGGDEAGGEDAAERDRGGGGDCTQLYFTWIWTGEARG